MANAKVEERIEASADKVWALVNWRAFGDLVKDFAGPIDYDGEQVGATRTIVTDEGDKLVERLVELNEGCDYTYTVDEYGPTPFRDYYSKVSVTPDGDEACMLTFQAEFTPFGETEENCVEMWQGVFQAPIAAIKKTLST